MNVINKYKRYKQAITAWHFSPAVQFQISDSFAPSYSRRKCLTSIEKLYKLFYCVLILQESQNALIFALSNLMVTSCSKK